MTVSPGCTWTPLAKLPVLISPIAAEGSTKKCESCQIAVPPRTASISIFKRCRNLEIGKNDSILAKSWCGSALHRLVGAFIWQGTMGQQHRVRTKRKRRKAYLKRKRTSARGTRRVPPKAKAKKPSSTGGIAGLPAHAGCPAAMRRRSRYLVVDGHSIIFAWPELRLLHNRRPSLAREALIKRLRDYQDWTGVRAVVVFDGRGPKVSQTSDPGEIQIFYSPHGRTADALIERLAAKYSADFDFLVATSDRLERETVLASGAESISPRALRELLEKRRAI